MIYIFFGATIGAHRTCHFRLSAKDREEEHTSQKWESNSAGFAKKGAEITFFKDKNVLWVEVRTGTRCISLKYFQ